MSCEVGTNTPFNARFWPGLPGTTLSVVTASLGNGRVWGRGTPLAVEPAEDPGFRISGLGIQDSGLNAQSSGFRGDLTVEPAEHVRMHLDHLLLARCRANLQQTSQ